MSTSPGSDQPPPRAAGRLSAVFGLLALAAFAWLWVLSATPFDPPNWVRILGLVFLPIGLVGALVTGIAGVRRPPRAWAVVGLAAAGATIVAFVLLVTLYG